MIIGRVKVREKGSIPQKQSSASLTSKKAENRSKGAPDDNGAACLACRQTDPNHATAQRP